MQIDRNKLYNLYIRTQAKMVVYAKLVKKAKSMYESMVYWGQVEYWKGRRDAYYLILKGIDENE